MVIAIPVFLIDGHLGTLDKVQFYEISLLSLNPFCDIIYTLGVFSLNKPLENIKSCMIFLCC